MNLAKHIHAFRSMVVLHLIRLQESINIQQLQRVLKFHVYYMFMHRKVDSIFKNTTFIRLGVFIITHLKVSVIVDMGIN